MPSHNIKQAHLDTLSPVCPQPQRHRPGWWVERNGSIIVCMPGPPGEMQPIWHEEVAPRLKEMVDDEVNYHPQYQDPGDVRSRH